MEIGNNKNLENIQILVISIFGKWKSEKLNINQSVNDK